MIQEAPILPQQLLLQQATGGDEYPPLTSARGSIQLRPSRDGGTRRSLAMPKGSKNMSQGILMSDRSGKSSRKSLDPNEQIAELKKQRRLFGGTTFSSADFTSPINYKYAQQLDKNSFQFKHIDQVMEEDPTYAEPDFIKQHRDEFELFLSKNRPDLTQKQLFEEEYMKLHAPLVGTLSQISTFYRHKRCPRHVRNFGSLAPSLPVQDYAPTSILVQDYHNGETHSPQKFQMPSIDSKNHYKNGTQLYKPTGGNILLSSQSSLMQSYTKLLMPTIDKEKLRQELNQLVAYRHRKLQIVQKLEAELAQIRFTNSQANVFNPSLTMRGTTANSPRDKLCCSPPQERKSPTKLLMQSSSRGMKKSMGMTLTNLYNFDVEKGFRSTGPINMEQKKAAYSRKSQFGHNSIEINEQNNNVQATTMPDDFSIVDMEFRKVQLQTKLNVKDQEFDEANLENQSLAYQLEKEKKQNLLNKKAFNQLLPTFEEYEAMGYRFQHIEALNYFRKFVAEHNLSEKTSELFNNHQEHKFQISKLIDQLKGEREQLHVISMQLQSRDQELNQLRIEIGQIRNTTANLGNIKKKWIAFLKIRYKEYRIIGILRIFFLISQLKNHSNLSSGSGSLFQRDSLEGNNKSKQMASSVEELNDIPDDEEEEKRNQIFTELQSMLLKFTQTTDLRSFCNQVLLLDMPDLIKFFNEDAIFEQQYAEVKDSLNEREVTQIYNQSQFAIASLQTTHDNLMHSKEKKKQQIIDLVRMKKVLMHHKDEIVDFLAQNNIAQRNEMDFTVDDLYNLKQVQSKYLNQSKQTLVFLIPQIRSYLAHTQHNISLFEQVIKSKIDGENLLSHVGNFLLGASMKRPNMNAIAIEAIEETNDMQSLNMDDMNNNQLSNSDSKSKIIYQSYDEKISPEKSPYQKANTQVLSDPKGNELASNKKKFVSQKTSNNWMAATAKGILKEKNKYVKKYTERPSSGLVANAPNVDFNDSDQVQNYLQQQTLESLNLLSSLGAFLKKCQISLIRLQNDQNNGEPMKIDYSHYERQFHDTHYMKTLSANIMNRDRFSSNASETPFGSGVNSSRGGSQVNHGQAVHFQQDVDFTKESQHRQHLQTQASTVKDDLSNDQRQRHSVKTANTGSQSHRGVISSGSGTLNTMMNSGIEQRGFYMGSTLMAYKFQRVRNLQSFELREKQFLRQFRKRIHESYFTNNAN